MRIVAQGLQALKLHVSSVERPLIVLLEHHGADQADDGDVAGSIRSKRVIEVLAKLISVRGAPTHLRSDNGPEFVSQAILEWLAAENINTAHIDPGKPWQNGADESFNGKFRDECLSMEWFRTRAEAKAVIEAWRRHYNHVRPHQSLKDRTPVEFAALYHSTHQGAILQL